MMIAFVSPPCSSPHTPTLPLCVFISHLLAQGSVTLLLSLPSHSPFLPASHFVFLFALSSPHTVNCQGTAHQSKTSIQMADFVKPSRDKHSPRTQEQSQLERQHLSDIFQASGCANNKIGVVCVSGTFHYFAPVCVVVVRAKIPTGYSCPVGRQETEHLPVQWSCQLTKSKLCRALSLFRSRRSAEFYINRASGLLLVQKHLDYSF